MAASSSAIMIRTPANPLQSMLLPLILPEQPEARIRAVAAVVPAGRALTCPKLGTEPSRSGAQDARATAQYGERPKSAPPRSAQITAGCPPRPQNTNPSTRTNEGGAGGARGGAHADPGAPLPGAACPILH